MDNNFQSRADIYGEPVFKITQKLTSKANADFRKFSVRKFGARPIAVITVFTAVMAYLGARAYSGGFYFWWFFAVSAVLTPIYFTIGIMRNIKANKKKEGAESVYLFYEEHFAILSAYGTENRDYGICEIYETDEYFYIVIGKSRRGYVIAKSEFEDDPCSFREFLKSRKWRKNTL